MAGQWWIYAGLVAAFVVVAYGNGPGPHPRLGALFLVTFFLLRGLVKWQERRRAQ